MAINKNGLYTLQLFRTATAANDLASAKALLQSADLEALKDGEIVALRYKETVNGEEVVKTLLAVVSKVGGKNSVTYIEDDSVVNAALDALKDIQGEDATKPFVTGLSVVDDKLTMTKSALSSTNGTISINGTALDVNVDGTTIKVTESGANKGELYADLSSVTYTGGDGVDINGTVIKAVAKTNDKIITVDTNGIQSTLNVARIAESDAGFAAIAIEGVTMANVKEVWQFTGANDALIGSIPVYKDNSLVGASLQKDGYTLDEDTGEITAPAEADAGDDVLVLVYRKADGKCTSVKINVADFLRESEFKNGLAVNGGEVSVKIKENDPVLEVSADGVAVKQNAVWDAATGKTIQNFRTSEVYANHDVAVAALEGTAFENRVDGEMVFARYIDTDGDVRTIAGLIYVGGEEGSEVRTITVLDTERYELTVAKAITQLNESCGFADDGTYAPTGLNYVTNVKNLAQAIAKLDAAIADVAADAVRFNDSGTVKTTKEEDGTFTLNVANDFVMDCGTF